MNRKFSLAFAAVLGGVFTLALSQTVNYSYDKAGRLVRVDYPNGRSIRYTYDAAGNLLRRESGGDTPAFASVSAASFERGAPLAPESIAAGFGVGLARETAVSDTLPTELAGTRVEVVDSGGTARPAGLFFVSPGQINYLVPAGVALGRATVRVSVAGAIVASGTIEIARVAPSLYTANARGTGVASAFFLRVGPDGSRIQDLIFDPFTQQAVPVDLGPEGAQVFLLLFGSGIRGFISEVTTTAGGSGVPVAGAVPQGQFAGLDQVNIGPLPRSLAGRGEVNIVLTADGRRANTVTVTIR